MRGLILFCLVLSLSACTIHVQSPTTGASLGGHAAIDADQKMFGTLCSARVECAAAPVMTRNAMFRRRAAADLRAERITVDAARAVLAVTDAVRTDLDRAVAAGDFTAIDRIDRMLRIEVNNYEVSKQ